MYIPGKNNTALNVYKCWTLDIPRRLRPVLPFVPSNSYGLPHYALNTNYSELQQLLSGLQTSVRDNRFKLQPIVKTVILCEKQSITMRSYSHDVPHLENHNDVFFGDAYGDTTGEDEWRAVVHLL